jgi:hypothetical protein
MDISIAPPKEKEQTPFKFIEFPIRVINKVTLCFGLISSPIPFFSGIHKVRFKKKISVHDHARGWRVIRSENICSSTRGAQEKL